MAKETERTQYDRYGLTGNPFHDLSSESLDSIDLFHVNQGVDGEISSLVNEVMERENKAIVALLGGLGAGKSERLRIIETNVHEEKHFFCRSDICAETRWVIRSVAEGIVQESKRSKGLKSSSWKKDLTRIAKNASEGYDPHIAGEAIASALNANAPAFLALNDLHWLEVSEDTDNFFHALHTVFDEVNKGVMIILTCSESYFGTLMAGRDSLKARINRTLVIPQLNDNEAGLMIAKRMLVKRVVEDMQPLYPFTQDAISVMNRTANGNPRELLKVADKVIDIAAKKKAIQIDEDLVNQALAQKPLAEVEAPCAEPGKSA